MTKYLLAAAISIISTSSFADADPFGSCEDFAIVACRTFSPEMKQECIQRAIFICENPIDPDPDAR